MILAADPGKRIAGLACFEGTELRWARHVSTQVDGDDVEIIRTLAAECMRHVGGTVERLVLEMPQVYTQGKWKGDPNDLMLLAAFDGALAALTAAKYVVCYRPAQWKGQIPPNVCARRVLKRLTPEEKLRIVGLDRFVAALEKAEKSNRDVKDLKCPEHNTVDAIGLGLFAVGRFAPMRAE